MGAPGAIEQQQSDYVFFIHTGATMSFLFQQ